jgi:uncharacterized membrane protein
MSTMTTSTTLANATRVLHDVGLAAWVGGSLFGKFALNPAVATVEKKTDRGKVVNAAWNGYNVINTLSLGAVTAGWLGARVTETRPENLSDTERALSLAKDGLVAAAVVTGVLNGIQGGRLAKQAPEGAVPIETGLTPAPETPPEAAKIQRSLALFGNLNIITGITLVAVNAVLAQLNYSRPPLRRGVMRRSS